MSASLVGSEMCIRDSSMYRATQAQRVEGMPPSRAARRAVCLKSDHEKLALVARRSSGPLLA
eukprot:14616780-Alexandrium_andersonii.AAC.1